MNNKGQSLALFVILIPLILILFIGVVDIGFIYIERRNIENTLSKAIDYYKDGKDVETFINKNISDIEDISIEENENNIKITLKKKNVGIIKNNTIEISKEG